MSSWKQIIPGGIITISIGLLALLLYPIFPIKLGSVIVSLLIGIILGNSFKLPENTNQGVNFASSTLLELSIVFLAFGFSYSEISKLGISSFFGIALMVLILLIATYFLAKYFKCPSNTGFLIGFGTTICGSAAIAALMPSLKDSKKEDVAISLAVVNLMGTIGMLIMPAVIQQLHLGASESALLIGGGLHSVGNVAGAAFSISPEIGEAALTVKLARVALLTPGLIFFTILINRGENTSWKQYLKLPWYLIAFIAVTIITSIFTFETAYVNDLKNTGHFILTVAMAGIGLKVDFRKLLSAGKRGIRFGVVIFIIQLLILGILINL